MKVNHTGAALCLVAALLLTLGTAAHAEPNVNDWPQFRGVHRDGISPETGLKQDWSDGGPKELWRQGIGEGYSAISVVGDRFYTMFATDHDGKPTEVAAAFEVSTGKELWRTPVGPKKDTEFGNGPRATPTVDGDTLYVLGSEGNFAALATADGTLRWEMKLQDAFGSKAPYWGYATSALVDGNQVVIETGGKEGKSYVGLDKKTGELKWSLGDTPAGYNSALLVEMGGKKRYVLVVSEKLMAIDEGGNEVWSHAWPKGETHAMPVFIAPDRFFASGGEGVGAHLLRVDENGKDSKVEELWETRFMRNHFSSSVVHDGTIYGFDNATLKAISVEDGKLAWAKRGLGKGSLILADGHLLVLSDRGKLLLVEATPDQYTEKGNMQALDGKSWTAPVLSNGRLYLRNHTEMVAFDLKK
jgi:outer membrane protein assembly factor BamB